MIQRALALASLIGLVLLACRPQTGSGAAADVPAPRAASYVGRATCAACHELELELWTGSHHDLAMEVAGEGTVLGDFDDASHTHGGVTSTFRRSASGGFVVRTEGADGQLEDFEIAYTFGVTPLQQYLVAFPGGRLQALGLAWDARPREAGGQRWFHLYPDEVIPAGDVLHWTGPNQNWNFMCAECHSTNLERGYDLATDTYETTWSELDVSCEACHGPGSEHVAWARAEERGERPADSASSTLGLVRDLAPDGGRWVIDVETGNATRTIPRRGHAEIEACAPCHSRRSVIAGQRIGDEPFLDAYRPALLESRLYHDDGQIRDEVYVYGSFRQSKMYAEGVTCSDCHQPHTARPWVPGNGMCFQCHYEPRYDSPEHHHHEPDSAGARCVECHMPETTYMVVDPRRDHSLRVPRPDLSVVLGTPNACNGCHTDRTAQWAADATLEWYGPKPERPPHFGEALHRAREGRPGARDALLRLITDLEAPSIARATALAELPDLPGPESPGRGESLAALATALRDEDPLVRAAALEGLEGVAPAARLPLALPLLGDPVRLVRIEAANQLAGVPARELPPAALPGLERALDEYRAAQLASADRPGSHLNLGNLEAALGDHEAAEAAYRTALRLDPSFVEGYVNLADLYRVQGREDQAESTLHAALAIAPGDGFVHHSLGLLLVRAGKTREAAESLGAAAALRPEVARFSYVHAICLQELGQTELALAVLERAHQRHPGDRGILAALVTLNRDAGAIEAALRHAQRLEALAPRDPALRQLVEELRAAEQRTDDRGTGDR